MKKTRLAIFASGTGSNAINIINFFSKSNTVEVGFLVSNKNDAPVIASCLKLGVSTRVISNEQANDGEHLIQLCTDSDIDFVLLLGYLRKIPSSFISHFSDKIVNLHPSLLPKYGGKGMYGHHVHEAVFAAKEKESGITIHYVNEEFDKGAIIAQFHTQLSSTDQPTDISKKVQKLEQCFLPTVVDFLLNN